MVIAVVTHGGLARELLAVAADIYGNLENVHAFCCERGHSHDELFAEVKALLDTLQDSEELLILTDLFGGSTSNVAGRLLTFPNCEVLTGVNLPMLLGALSYRKRLGKKELVKKVIAAGKKNIVDMRSMMDGRAGGPSNSGAKIGVAES